MPPSTTCVATHLLIEGRVQGVYFRASLQQLARQYQLAGWCRNLQPQQAVEALLVGPAAAVAAVTHWAQTGPPLAQVQQVQKEPVSAAQQATALAQYYPFAVLPTARNGAPVP